MVDGAPVPTGGGPVWFKATGPAVAFEAGLYELLQRAAPAQVLTPIATDTGRGWLLMPDGGPALGDSFAGEDLVRATETAVRQYAQLQRAVAPEVERLLTLGVTDMRAAVMPARFDEAVAAVREHVERHGDDAERAAFERVRAARGRFVSWCDQLASAPVPPSLDHNDLHAWNILLSGDTSAGPRFYDWGDSVVAHPFSSMLVCLGFVRLHLDVAPDAPPVLRVRDAYLEMFTDLAPRAELVGALEVACRVGKVARALTWDRAVRSLAGEFDVDPDFASAPARTLLSLTDKSHLGGA